MKLSIRKKGLIKFILGSIGFAIVFQYLVSQGLNSGSGTRGNFGYLLIIVSPGVLALIGIVQLITGRAFSEFEELWMELDGWQRGVLGTFILVMSIAVICGIFAVAVLFEII